MKIKKFVPLFMTAIFICSPLALAEKGGNGHGHGHGKHKKDKEHHDGNDNADSRYRFQDSDRIVVREYIAQDYQSHCPPGLAKKHNGCLPPGQAKKLYRVGHTLSSTVHWVPLPAPLLGRLQPVPVGYQYVMVDKDVLLISEASHHVIDAVTLLSAVGK